MICRLCEANAMPGRTTCVKHYSAGRPLSKEEARRERQKRGPRVVRKAITKSQGLEIIPGRFPF